jgi:hypothetical protein
MGGRRRRRRVPARQEVLAIKTKPSPVQQLKDHVLVWLVNNPDHAVRIHRVTSAVKRWWNS